MYQRIIKPLLFSLTIERAHSAVMLLLRILGVIPGGRWLLRKCYAVEHPALEREVFGVRFPNPVGLAAGFDRSGEAFRELAALGFGYVEVGTVTPRPQSGNPRPRVFRLPKDNAIVNRIGLSNRGLEAAIRHLRRPHDGVIVGCNIGKNTTTPAENAPADYLKLFRNLYQYADYFTVNISCDNACREGVSHTREYILRILNPLFDFRRGQNQYRPVMLKISPDMSDEVIDQITDVMLETPLDGIVATNGTHSREGLRTSHTSLEKIGSGRLSGAPLTRRAVEIVRRVHTRSGGTYPIIGVGGLMSADDVRAMLDAGADLVQLYTGYIYNGPGIVKEVCHALIADAREREQAAARALAEKAVAAAAAEERAAAEREAAEAEARAAEKKAEEADTEISAKANGPATEKSTEAVEAETYAAKAETPAQADRQTAQNHAETTEAKTNPAHADANGPATEKSAEAVEAKTYVAKAETPAQADRQTAQNHAETTEAKTNPAHADANGPATEKSTEAVEAETYAAKAEKPAQADRQTAQNHAETIRTSGKPAENAAVSISDSQKSDASRTPDPEAPSADTPQRPAEAKQ